MFNWLKRNPVAALQKKYERLLVEARDLQRNGDIIGYSVKTAEAEEVLLQIDELRASS